MNTRKVAFTFIFLLLFSFHHEIAHGQELFYEGGITIDSITADIALDTNANVFVVYRLRNEGEIEEAVTLEYLSIPAALHIGDHKIENPVTFNPGEEKEVTLGFAVDIGGDSTKRFSFDPTLSFNGKTNSERAGHYLVRVFLPPGVNKIIGASREYTHKEEDPDGRCLYQWDHVDVYPTRLSIMWSISGIDLQVGKTATPKRITSPNETITIRVVIENKGHEAVSGIRIIDDYEPMSYEAVEPLESFQLSESENSDPWLFWIAEINLLHPGEIREFNYSIRYIGDVSMIYDFTLAPSRVTVDDNLVSVSNSVTLTKMVGAKLAGEEGPAELSIPPTPPKTLDPLFIVLIAAGAVIGVGLIVTGIVLGRRRK